MYHVPQLPPEFVPLSPQQQTQSKVPVTEVPDSPKITATDKWVSDSGYTGETDLEEGFEGHL